MSEAALLDRSIKSEKERGGGEERERKKKRNKERERKRERPLSEIYLFRSHKASTAFIRERCFAIV